MGSFPGRWTFSIGAVGWGLTGCLVLWSLIMWVSLSGWGWAKVQTSSRDLVPGVTPPHLPKEISRV